MLLEAEEVMLLEAVDVVLLEAMDLGTPPPGLMEGRPMLLSHATGPRGAHASERAVVGDRRARSSS